MARLPSIGIAFVAPADVNKFRLGLSSAFRYAAQRDKQSIHRILSKLLCRLKLEPVTVPTYKATENAFLSMSIAYVEGHDLVPVGRYLKELGKPRCPDGRCRTLISYVKGHQRASRGETVPVMGHYRSLPHEPHGAGCKFNVEASLRRILDKSSLIQTPFRAVAQGRSAIFHLNVAMDALRHVDEGTTPGEARRLVAGRHALASGRQVLSRCLRSAKAILALVARVQERDKIADMVSIKYKDRNVAWDEFFYDEDSPSVLLHRMLQGPISHPVALATSARLRFRPSWRSADDFVQCYYSILDTPDGTIKTSPEIHGPNALLERVERNGWNLVFGIPTLRTRVSSKGETFQNIAFVLSSNHQFCRYTPALEAD